MLIHPTSCREEKGSWIQWTMGLELGRPEERFKLLEHSKWKMTKAWMGVAIIEIREWRVRGENEGFVQKNCPFLV